MSHTMRTSFETGELDAIALLADTEHTIVAAPSREGWALVDHFGRIVATGGYGECLRQMARLAR
jgi:hypothetical protein